MSALGLLGRDLAVKANPQLNVRAKACILNAKLSLSGTEAKRAK